MDRALKLVEKVASDGCIELNIITRGDEGYSTNSFASEKRCFWEANGSAPEIGYFVTGHGPAALFLLMIGSITD